MNHHAELRLRASYGNILNSSRRTLSAARTTALAVLREAALISDLLDARHLERVCRNTGRHTAAAGTYPPKCGTCGRDA